MSAQSLQGDNDRLQKMLADMVARITVLERTCAEKDAFLKDTMAEVAVLRSKVDCLVSQNVRAAVIMSETKPITKLPGSTAAEHSRGESSPRTQMQRIVPFGYATEVMVTQYNLPPKTHTEMYEYEENDHHLDWYWKLVSESGLGHDISRTLARAMYMDRDFEWDDKECMSTPWS